MAHRSLQTLQIGRRVHVVGNRQEARAESSGSQPGACLPAGALGPPVDVAEKLWQLADGKRQPDEIETAVMRRADNRARALEGCEGLQQTPAGQGRAVSTDDHDALKALALELCEQAGKPRAQIATPLDAHTDGTRNAQSARHPSCSRPMRRSQTEKLVDSRGKGGNLAHHHLHAGFVEGERLSVCEGRNQTGLNAPAVRVAGKDDQGGFGGSGHEKSGCPRGQPVNASGEARAK